MKTAALLLIPVALLCTSIAYAKRAAPADVAPVTTDGLEYRAPHSQMGCVEAWDPVQNQLVWRRQVYVVKYDLALERDIQDVFIKSLEVSERKLIVKNEHRGEYELDLDTLEVKVRQGVLVELIK
jgi:hypothetical protein